MRKTKKSLVFLSRAAYNDSRTNTNVRRITMKAMKKFLASIVALVMAVSCMATAFAAGSVSVSASNKSAKPGDIIEIAVSVSEASFAGYSL